MDSFLSYTAFPDDSEFLDAEPLHLSDHGALDDIDFLFDSSKPVDHGLGTEDIHDDGEEDDNLASSRGSADLDNLLAGSGTSSAAQMVMDLQFESLSGSLHDMELDGEGGQEQKQKPRQYRPALRAQRKQRSPSSHDHKKHQRPQINAVNFDPPAQPRHQWQQQSQRFEPAQRHLSVGDISVCSYATAHSSSTTQFDRRASDGMAYEIQENIALQRQQEQLHQQQQYSESQYNTALQRLADSMKRSEESRNQVLMQRKILSQQAVLSPADQAQWRNEQAQRQQQVTILQTPENPQVSSRSLSPGRSSIMAAFFSGSRGTLTNGLEHSRRQLSIYMGQMNNHTL